jgi:hypothetical protein
MKRLGTYTILGIAFCYIGRYGGDFVKKYGSRFLDECGFAAKGDSCPPRGTRTMHVEICVDYRYPVDN